MQAQRAACSWKHILDNQVLTDLAHLYWVLLLADLYQTFSQIPKSILHRYSWNEITGTRYQFLMKPCNASIFCPSLGGNSLILFKLDCWPQNLWSPSNPMKHSLPQRSQIHSCADMTRKRPLINVVIDNHLFDGIRVALQQHLLFLRSHGKTPTA